MFSEDGREIQAPTGALRKLHERVAILLRRIALPDYVHSQRGRSYVTNARVHASDEPTIKTDVSGYFANTRSDAVRVFFRDVMECSNDTAWLLTELLCYDGYVPTGSPVSNELAFFANRPTLDAIHALATSRGCRMTLLTDDITITGSCASRRMLNQIEMILRAANHSANLNPRKTRSYGPGQVKHITGTVVVGPETKLPNRRHKNLREAFLRANVAITRKEVRAARLKLRGCLAEAKNVDANSISPKFTQCLRSRRRRVVASRPLLKHAA